MKIKKKCSVNVKGKKHIWRVQVYATMEQIKRWDQDGLDVGIEIYSIPEVIMRLGLVRPWCFMQDIFNFRNPFSKK